LGFQQPPIEFKPQQHRHPFAGKTLHGTAVMHHLAEVGQGFREQVQVPQQRGQDGEMGHGRDARFCRP
jgi:hypothetical protein